MTDQVHTNETQRGFFAGILNVLGLIAAPNGFFGPGFWADFKEGYNESRQPRQPLIAVDEDVTHDERDTLITLDQSPADPFDYLGYDNYLNYLKLK